MKAAVTILRMRIEVYRLRSEVVGTRGILHGGYQKHVLKFTPSSQVLQINRSWQQSRKFLFRGKKNDSRTARALK